MIHLQKINLKLCRLCGKDKPRGTDVFEDKIKGAVLISIINKYFPKEVINVSTNDIFSKYVCMDCEQKICSFDEFCLMVANVQKQLTAPSLEIDFAEDMLCHLKENELSIDKEKYYSIDDNNKKHKCQQCGKTFRCHAHLERHNRIHTGQRPFVCNICQMSFNQPEILTKHLESHQARKMYNCNICNQSFRFKVSLKSHMLNLHPSNDNTIITNNKNKSLNCIDCGKIFATKYKLQRHMRCHTGERPYNCNYCNRTFSQTGNLKLHQLKCSSTIIEIQNIQQQQQLQHSTNIQQQHNNNDKLICLNNDLNEQTIDHHYSQIYITDSDINQTINETINSTVNDTSSYLKNYDNQIYNIDNDIETILNCDVDHLQTTSKYTNNDDDVDKLSHCLKQPETPELIHSLLYDEL